MRSGKLGCAIETMRMQSRALAWTLLVATTLAAGCSANPRAASKENFQRAIDAKLANSSRLCLEGPNSILTNELVLPYRMLARAIPMDAILPQGVVVFEPTQHRQLAALASAGLAARRTITVTAHRQYYKQVRLTSNGLSYEQYRTMSQELRVPAELYERGPDFAKYARPAANSAASSSNEVTGIGALCFASLAVDHIDNYSEPGQLMGQTLSQVQYHAKVVGIADWANTPAMRSAFPTIEQQLQQAGTRGQSDMVVLMNDGWQAQ